MRFYQNFSNTNELCHQNVMDRFSDVFDCESREKKFESKMECSVHINVTVRKFSSLFVVDHCGICFESKKKKKIKDFRIIDLDQRKKKLSTSTRSNALCFLLISIID